MNDPFPFAFPAAAAAPVRLPEPTGDVRLWWCSTNADDDALEALRSWLSPEERQRSARFGSAALARRYIVGRASLRYVLGGLLGERPADVRIERGRRGRPRLRGGEIDFNVSNTRSVALVGTTASASVRIGVDVEHGDRAVNHAGLARKFCTPAEAAALAGLDDDARRLRFLRLWTCKEAMSKATGDALSAPLRRLGVSTAPRLCLAEGPPPYVPADWTLHEADVPAGYIATVALWRGAAAGADGLTR
ncbi:MAG TPA: 4'-phosphopantetheinyl transferase superfamily protein [Casimicrobiaceae bacterium]|nr:4'-phosphopantetheinyl transferase superfamily protein [Casimicrobiaceae bacterium]